MIRVMIVDDQTLMRDGLKTILELEEDIDVVAPNKSMTQVPDTGHLIFFDDQKGFSEVVKQILRGK